MTDPPLEPREPSPRAEPNADPDGPTQVQPPRPDPASAPPPGPRGLYRSRDDRVLAGVCGGLGEYFKIDAVLVRIAFVLLVFAGGLGILAYVLGWIFIAEEPGFADGGQPEPAFDRAGDGLGDDRRSGAVVLGLVFVGLGILFLLDIAWPDFLSWRYAWPIALIAVGAAIVLRARR